MLFSVARAARVAAAGAVLATALPSGALADAVPATLRVEASGAALERGTTYLTDTARLRTDDRPRCGGSGKVAAVPGATALGLLASGAAGNRRLRPLGVSDRFEFGLTVCAAGGRTGWEQAYWLYRVNHRAAEVGGDAYRVRAGDEVLWYFSEPGAGRNTGDELEVTAPARVAPGASFTVRVWAYDAGGRRRPAAGATLAGLDAAPSDAAGRTRGVLERPGRVTLRATRGEDIASAPLVVCAGAGDRCPVRRGRRIVGGPAADRIRGTRGPDRIAAAGGRRDRVRCGPGRDRVVADRGDVVAADCESVDRRQ